MGVLVRIVHDRDDDETIGPFADMADAIAEVLASENARHGTKKESLAPLFGWVSEDRTQFGTGYHYVMFEEVD